LARLLAHLHRRFERFQRLAAPLPSQSIEAIKYLIPEYKLSALRLNATVHSPQAASKTMPRVRPLGKKMSVFRNLFWGGQTLAVGHFEESGRQPLAGDLDPGQARFDSGHVLIGKAHLGRAEVFFHTVQAARAEDRHDAGPSCEEPGERHLRGRGAFGRGELFDRLDHSLVGLHSLGSEARRSRAEVVHTEVRRTRNLAGQVAGSGRAPGHEADAQFRAERQHLRLWVAGPQRVFALDRGDRLDGVGAEDSVRRRF
jgi:hypothetical protein